MPLTHPNMTLVDVAADARLTAVQKEDKLVMEGKLDIQFPVRNRNYSIPWFAMWKSEENHKTTGGSMGDLATMDLTLTQHRLLLMILDCCSPGNRVNFKQRDIAKHLGVNESSIYRALKGLMAKNILLKEKFHHGWKVNPRVGWFGSPHEGTRAIKDAPLIKAMARPKLTLVK